MKKFFTVVPLQARPLGDRKGMLELTKYDAEINPNLHIEEKTRFPIFHLMVNSAYQGEQITLYALRMESKEKEENENTAYNLGLLQDELNQFQQKYGFECTLQIIALPKRQTPAVQAQYFLKLIELFENGDELHCCITYGEKPLPIVLFAALSYAALAREGFHVARICYGQKEFIAQKAFIYDVTALFSMHHLATDAVRFGINQPDEYIHAALNLLNPEKEKQEDTNE